MQGKRFWRAYCVFVGGSRKGSEITTNKKIAVKTARLHGGEVRAIGWDYYRSCSSWDYPTFYVCSEQIADFRQKASV